MTYYQPSVSLGEPQEITETMPAELGSSYGPLIPNGWEGARPEGDRKRL